MESDLNALFKLMASSVNEELDELQCYALTSTAGNAELHSVFIEMKAIQKQEMLREAAIDMLTVAKETDHIVRALVAQLRTLRESEQRVMSRIKAINRATQYAAETFNYVPLLSLTGNEHVIRHGISSGVLTNIADQVPADWKPKAAPATKPKPKAKAA